MTRVPRRPIPVWGHDLVRSPVGGVAGATTVRPSRARYPAPGGSYSVNVKLLRHPNERVEPPDSHRHRPHRSLNAVAPLKPPPGPVDLEQYRVRRQTCAGGSISEYRLVV
jgi:hypothetical protein